MSNLCVYVYLDPRKPGRWHTTVATFLYEPIYVGEGKRTRVRCHLKDTAGHTLKANKIKKIQSEYGDPYHFVIADGLSGDESVILEALLIREIGTLSNISSVKRGPLTNMLVNDAGKRVISDEVRAKLSSSIKKSHPRLSPTEETRKKISNAWNSHRESTVKKISASYNRSDEAKKNRSAAQRQRASPSAETRNKISLTQAGKPKGDNHRLKIGVALSGKPKSTLHKQKLAAHKRKAWLVNGHLVTNLPEWCRQQEISYEALKSAFRRGKSYQGLTLTTHVIMLAPHISGDLLDS